MVLPHVKNVDHVFLKTDVCIFRDLSDQRAKISTAFKRISIIKIIYSHSHVYLNNLTNM